MATLPLQDVVYFSDHNTTCTGNLYYQSEKSVLAMHNWERALPIVTLLTISPPPAYAFCTLQAPYAQILHAWTKLPVYYALTYPHSRLRRDLHPNNHLILLRVLRWQAQLCSGAS